MPGPSGCVLDKPTKKIDTLSQASAANCTSDEGRRNGLIGIYAAGIFDNVAGALTSTSTHEKKKVITNIEGKLLADSGTS